MTETRTTSTVTQRLATLIAEAGAGHTFGVVGTEHRELARALDDAGVDFTAARHESSAATMADAFTRCTEEFGLVSVHQGYGLTNAITGITEAVKASTGMIVIAADTAADAIADGCDIDQDALAQAVGAVSLRIDSPDQVYDTADRAVARAASGATVVISLPVDVQSQPAPDTPELHDAHPHRTGTIPVHSQILRASRSLAEAERPLVLAGRGALSAGPELVQLADASGALLATSAVAHGLFADHDWNLGISGTFSSPVAAQLIQEADCVVAFGCALNNWTIRNGELINDDATLIHVDTSPEAIGLHRAVSQGIVADSASVATAITAGLDVITEHPDRTGYRTEAVAQQLKRRFSNDEPLGVDGPGDMSTADRIDPRVITAHLDPLLPRERVVAVDSGHFVGYPAAYLRVPDARGFCFTQAFQSPGLGLATVIGAAVAQPRRLPVLGVDADGFATSIAELDTLVDQQIPALVLVYNDSVDTDFTAPAVGHGGIGATVHKVEDLDVVTDWLDTIETHDDGGLSGQPLILDAKTVSDSGARWLHHRLNHHNRTAE